MSSLTDDNVSSFHQHHWCYTCSHVHVWRGRSNCIGSWRVYSHTVKMQQIYAHWCSFSHFLPCLDDSHSPSPRKKITRETFLTWSISFVIDFDNVDGSFKICPWKDILYIHINKRKTLTSKIQFLFVSLFDTRSNYWILPNTYSKHISKMSLLCSHSTIYFSLIINLQRSNYAFLTSETISRKTEHRNPYITSHLQCKLDVLLQSCISQHQMKIASVPHVRGFD